MQPPRPAPWQALVSRANGECVDLSGGLAGNTPVITRPCGDVIAQRFKHTQAGDLVVGSLCVAVRDSIPAAPVAAVTCNGAQEQKWRFEWDGSVRSLRAGAPRCLASTGDGRIVVADCRADVPEQQFLPRPLAAYVNKATGWCLDSEGGAVAGKRMIAWTCHGGANQSLEWVRGPHQRIRIGELCVHATDAADKADVVVRDCDGSVNQLWAVEPDGLLRSLMPGRPYCMDLSTEDGGNISMLGCWPGSKDQQFRQTTRMTLASHIDGNCLDVSGSIGINRRLITHGCHGEENQEFRALSDGSLVAGNVCVGVSGDNRNMAPVVTATCNGSLSQKWIVAWDGTLRSRMAGVQRCMEPMLSTIYLWECMRGDRHHQFRAFPTVEFTNLGNDRCMDVRGGVGRGRSVVTWNCHGGPNQRFRIEYDNALRIGSLCVTAGRAIENGVVTLENCTQAPNQQWSVDSHGSLRSLLPGRPYCITMPTKHGAGVSLQRCSPISKDQAFEPV